MRSLLIFSITLVIISSIIVGSLTSIFAFKVIIVKIIRTTPRIENNGNFGLIDLLNFLKILNHNQIKDYQSTSRTIPQNKY